MQKIFCFALLSLFCGKMAYSQVVDDQLPFLSEYKAELPYFQELITGGQYVEASKQIEGDSFYVSRQFGEGELTVTGITYPGVPLVYDIYQDLVITFHPIYNQKILINSQKIDAFQLSNGERFERISSNSSYNFNRNGFYQLRVSGTAKLWIKRYKTTKAKKDLSKYSDVFIEKRDFFLEGDSTFTQISKAKQAIEFLELDKKVVKKEMKQKKLRFKQSPEAYLSQLTELANQNTVQQND